MRPENVDDRPWVVVNMAMTADGKIATAGREVTTFGSPRDLKALYSLRATADAILCGARTVEETGATLGNGGRVFLRRRIRAGLSPMPLRVVVSGMATLDPSAAIWKEKGSPIVVLTSSEAPVGTRKRLESLADAVWVSPSKGLDLEAALAWLWTRWGVRRLICEGGGSLNATMFRSGLVDELRVTLCPRVFGGTASPTIADGTPGNLVDAFRLGRPEVRFHGGELYATWKAVRGRSTVPPSGKPRHRTPAKRPKPKSRPAPTKRAPRADS
jgi:riboflavin-specific deaminase-like protein